MTRTLTTIIRREGDAFVAWCPALDIASQGETVEAARANVQEAIDLFIEVASPEEVAQRLAGEVLVTEIEVALG